MVAKGLVRRISIGECHLAITEHSWKSKTVSLARLRSIEASMIMLFATLPLHMETDLELSLKCELSNSPHDGAAVEVWKEAGGCVAATTALDTGGNYSRIVLAVHVDMPYALVNFAHKLERAGRAGEVVTSLALLVSDWQAKEQAKLMAKRREWSPDKMAMLEFLNTDNCQRLMLG